eukprot:SAG31_NODE_895_length_11169_cov_3.114182_2_plen_152_part_00
MCAAQRPIGRGKTGGSGQAKLNAKIPHILTVNIDSDKGLNALCPLSIVLTLPMRQACTLVSTFFHTAGILAQIVDTPANKSTMAGTSLVTAIQRPHPCLPPPQVPRHIDSFINVAAPLSCRRAAATVFQQQQVFNPLHRAREAVPLPPVAV